MFTYISTSIEYQVHSKAFQGCMLQSSLTTTVIYCSIYLHHLLFKEKQGEGNVSFVYAVQLQPWDAYCAHVIPYLYSIYYLRETTTSRASTFIRK